MTQCSEHKEEENAPSKQFFNKKKGKRFGPSHAPSGSMARKQVSNDESTRFIREFVQTLTNSIISKVCESQEDSQDWSEERKQQDLPAEFFSLGATPTSATAAATAATTPKMQPQHQPAPQQPRGPPFKKKNGGHGKGSNAGADFRRPSFGKKFKEEVEVEAAPPLPASTQLPQQKKQAQQ